MNQKQIIKKLIDFRNKRNWEKFHTLANLACAAHIEAGELNELFLWGKNPSDERLKEEIADTAIFLLYMCKKKDFDLFDIILEKIEKNELKYPIGLDHGKIKGWE